MKQLLDKIRPAGSQAARQAAPRSLAVEVGVSALRAVRVARTGDRLGVVAALEAPRAREDGVGRDEAEAVAATARAALGGEASERAVLALPREQALLSISELPSDDEAELRSMARLAIAREASAEGVETLGDFQYLERAAGRSTALVVGVPRAALDGAVSATGFAVERASLRALGMAALVRRDPALASGTTIAIDVCADLVECTVVDDGRFVHARGAALTGARSTHAAAVVTEFRRGLASLRAARPGFAASRVIVAAPAEIFAAVEAQVAASAGCGCSRLERHPRVECADPVVRETLLGACWPLAGLLLEDDEAVSSDGRAIDLLHPTPPIDVAARIRQRVLMAAGILLVACLAGWTLGRQSWNALESRHDDLEAKARGALPELQRTKRDELRLGHIEAFERISPDWLGHLDALRRFAPDPSAVVLDGLSAQLGGTEVTYTGGGRFAATPELKFILDGEASDRAVADALRDALVKEKGYTLGSTGADARGGRRLPYPFAYTVRTGDLSPKAAASPPPAAPRAAAGGAS